MRRVPDPAHQGAVGAVIALALFAGGTCLSLPALPASFLAAQESGRPYETGTDATTPDTASLREDARGAQERFERVRRRNVPWARRSWSGPCDETIGRFCIWHTPGSDWVPPADPSSIVEARTRLLDELETVARSIPGDAWVLGQRVRYLGEADRWEEAARIARDCRGGEGWWCQALLGFVLHNQSAFPAAEEAFARALEQMPGDRQEDWTDPAILLDSDGQRLLARASPDEEERLRRRIWWLGDPLYLIPGNERWTEHLARHVMIEIQRDARNPHWLRWGDDMSEILVRFGWSVAWERIRPDPLAPMTSLSVVGRERPNSLRFLPVGSSVADPGGIDPRAWRIHDPRPRSKYASPHVKRVEELPHHVALFRRKDSVLVVAAYELPDDVGPAATPAQVGEGAARDVSEGAGEGREAGSDVGSDFEGGLFLVPQDLPPGAELPRSGSQASTATSSRSGVFVSHAPSGAYIMSVEVWSPSRASAWRHRRDLLPADRAEGVPGISDLLLHRIADGLPESAEEAALLALTSTRIPRGEVLGVAWELYDVSPREALSFRITVEPEEGGRLRRLGQWMGLVEAPPTIVIAWTEAGPDGGDPHFRSAELELDSIEPGRYVLHLEVGLRGRSPLHSARPIELVP